jgi:YidC/Oxa1 family membrane protein insertase
MVGFFETIIYIPLLNALFFLTSFSPWSDIGISIVLLTIIVRFALFPVTHASTKTQAKMRELEPVLNKIKEDHKNDQDAQARKMIELYKEHGLNPAIGCLTLLIQIPVVLGLFWVFKDIHANPMLLGNVYVSPSSILDTSLLYPFTPIPAFVRTSFLGIFDITGKSLVLALLAGVTQYIQSALSMPGGKLTLKSTGSFKEDLMQNMKFQMRYFLPVMVAVFAYSVSAAVALYWVTSNVFTVVHELIIHREAKKLTV